MKVIATEDMDVANVELELRGLEKVDEFVEVSLHLEHPELQAPPWDVLLAFWNEECDALYYPLCEPLSEEQLPRDLGDMDLKSFFLLTKGQRDHFLLRYMENLIAADPHAKVIVELRGPETIMVKFSYGDDDPQYVLYSVEAFMPLENLKAYFRPL